MSQPSFGEAELANLREVIESQELWRGSSGNFVPRFEQAFGEHLGRKYVLGVTSGTCANETVLAGLGLEPGDEVICPASAPIFVSLPAVSLGCVPVFADVDPRTMIISPEGIEARVTPQTRAVVVVHLYGQPAPMDEIMSVARKHNLKVVEDCAQAFDCYCGDRKAGTIGDVTCFSLQQSKHITSGEGGIVATDDPEIYKRAVQYSNCGMPWYQYDLEPPQPASLGGLATRGHFAFGHNYRMSELQGAVALAQIDKMDDMLAGYRRAKKWINEAIEPLPGLRFRRLTDTAGDTGICLVMFLPDAETTQKALRALQTEGVPAGGVYDSKVRDWHIFTYWEHILDKKTVAPDGLPWSAVPPKELPKYSRDMCPRALDLLSRSIHVDVNYHYSSEDCQAIARGINKVMRAYLG